MEREVPSGRHVAQRRVSRHIVRAVVGRELSLGRCKSSGLANVDVDRNNHNNDSDNNNNNDNGNDNDVRQSTTRHGTSRAQLLMHRNIKAPVPPGSSTVEPCPAVFILGASIPAPAGSCREPLTFMCKGDLCRFPTA